MKNEKELICDYLNENGIEFSCDDTAFVIKDTGVKKYFSDFSIQNGKIIKKTNFLKNEKKRENEQNEAKAEFIRLENLDLSPVKKLSKKGKVKYRAYLNQLEKDALGYEPVTKRKREKKPLFVLEGNFIAQERKDAMELLKEKDGIRLSIEGYKRNLSDIAGTQNRIEQLRLQADKLEVILKKKINKQNALSMKFKRRGLTIENAF